MAQSLPSPAQAQRSADTRAWLIVSGVTVLWLIAYNSVKPLADWLTFALLGLAPGSRLGDAVAFFLYDVPKILLLLTGMIFAISTLRTFFSAERVRQTLGGKREGVGNVIGAGLGVLTPFCSCSAVPLFIGFVKAGVPLGVTFSFLIAAPMVDGVALALLLGLFGWQLAGLYVISGMTIAIVAGLIIGRMNMERHVEDFVWEIRGGDGAIAEEQYTWTRRFDEAWEQVREIVGKVWPYVVIGIAIGAGIHGFVPEDALAGIMGKEAWWSVPAGVILGVPLYSNVAGVIPVVDALMAKGAAMGTMLAFMMSVVALSLPELIILRRVLKPRLIATFVGIVATGIMLVGYLFNLVI
ncbi:MAG: permease [Chloroflexia bacterium]|nr:permease [Chloroflexia bacterium]